MNILLDLFLTFAKIGLFTFGGGYAMIAMIENNCVERKKWITHDEMRQSKKIFKSWRKQKLSLWKSKRNLKKSTGLHWRSFRPRKAFWIITTF